MKQTYKWLLLVLLFAGAGTRVEARKPAEPPVKNVIFLIGDGMGIADVTATAIHQGCVPLEMERAHYVGFSRTYSANNRVTDSAAGGTALATGRKTNNGSIGVDPDRQPVQSILEKAEANGLATGIVVTHSVTNATPAAFVAHQPSRKMEEEIAADYLKTDIDVFIGGGRMRFDQRADGRDLTQELQAKGYTVAGTMEEVQAFRSGKLAALLYENTVPTMADGRGDYLPQATAKALEILEANSPKGFFIMIEGSQIDKGGHGNDIRTILNEMLDFDQAVKVAYDYADRHPGTLVVVTADHETGGVTLPSGKPDFTLPDQGVNYSFSTKSHTACYVPVFAYGAGARHFGRVLENTDIPQIMERLLRLKK